MAKHYRLIADEIKTKILKLHDPLENIKTLDAKTVEELSRKNPALKSAKSDEMNKIFRIFCTNNIQICGVKNLYSNTSEGGFFYTFSLINHSCVPNVVSSWVMGDFKRRRVRALKTIEKDEEILISYRNSAEFIYGSRESRRQELLEDGVFLCECSECSLEGQDLEDNERMRAEIREKKVEITELVNCEGHIPLIRPSRRDVKKAMKLTQQRINLVQKLDIRAGIFCGMIDFYQFAVLARRMNISTPLDPESYRREALKYAKMFGDHFIHDVSTLQHF